jgi:hypothetical protein
MSLDNYTSESELLNGLRHSEANRRRTSPERLRFVILCNIHCRPLYHDLFSLPLCRMRVTDYRSGFSEVFLYGIRKIFLCLAFFMIINAKNNISDSGIVYS